MDKFIIWGSSGHAKVVHEVIEKTGSLLVALFDNSNQASAAVENVPLFIGPNGFEKWYQTLVDPISAVVAIGGKNNSQRCKIYEYLTGYKLITAPTLIHQDAHVSSSAKFGNGVQILAGATISVGVSIEDYSIINTSASVDHECLIRKAVHIGPGATLCGCVEVGEFSFIGAGSTVLPRVKIGKNVIVGAGSVVTRNVEDNMIIMGVPAKNVRRV